MVALKWKNGCGVSEEDGFFRFDILKITPGSSDMGKKDDKDHLQTW